MLFIFPLLPYLLAGKTPKQHRNEVIDLTSNKRARTTQDYEELSDSDDDDEVVWISPTTSTTTPIVSTGSYEAEGSVIPQGRWVDYDDISGDTSSDDEPVWSATHTRSPRRVVGGGGSGRSSSSSAPYAYLDSDDENTPSPNDPGEETETDEEMDFSTTTTDSVVPAAVDALLVAPVNVVGGGGSSASSAPAMSTPLPGHHEPGVVRWLEKIVTPLKKLLELAQQRDYGALVSPRFIEDLRNTVGALHGAVIRMASPPFDQQKRARMMRMGTEPAYHALVAMVAQVKRELMNVVDGPVLETGVLLIQALYIVDIYLLGRPAARDGWAADVARLGLRFSLAPYTWTAPLPVPANSSQADRVRELASADLLPEFPALLIGGNTSLIDIGNAFRVFRGATGVPERRKARLIAALLRVHLPVNMPACDRLAIGRSLAPPAPGNFTLRLAVGNWIRPLRAFVEGTGEFLRHDVSVVFIGSGGNVSVDNRARWIEAMINGSFAVNRSVPLWEYSNEARTSIRPRRLPANETSLEYQARKRKLVACGRLLGMALRYNIIARVNLSPATLALLHTSIRDDLVEVAKLENPTAWNAIVQLVNIDPRDRSAVKRAFSNPPSGWGYGMDRASMHNVLRRHALMEIVMSIRTEVGLVREGIYQVFPRRDHLDVLTSDELHELILGPTQLTADLVLNGTLFYHRTDVNVKESLRWYAAIVRGMTTDDLRLLVRYITGFDRPPMDYLRPGRKWMRVLLDAPVSLTISPRKPNDMLNLPKYANQELMRYYLYRLIRPTVPRMNVVPILGAAGDEDQRSTTSTTTMEYTEPTDSPDEIVNAPPAVAATTTTTAPASGVAANRLHSEARQAALDVVMPLIRELAKLHALARTLDFDSLLDPSSAIEKTRIAVAAISRFQFPLSLAAETRASAVSILYVSEVYYALVQLVAIRKQEMINSVDGPLFEATVLLIQTLGWIQTKLLGHPATDSAAADGWEMDVSRLGLPLSPSGEQLVPSQRAPSGEASSPDRQLHELTSGDILGGRVTVSAASGRLNVVGCIRDPRVSANASRRRARLGAALLKVNQNNPAVPPLPVFTRLRLRVAADIYNATLRIRAGEAELDSRTFLESPLTQGWKFRTNIGTIAYVDATGEVVRTGSLREWIESMVRTFISPSTWPYSDESKTSLRAPRKMDVDPSI